MDEQVDIIDDSNQVLFSTSKDRAHAEGLPHRVSAVFVQRPDGKLLTPTAAGHKTEAGRLYHSAAGHVSAGETYLEAAVRELSEETGVITSAESLEELGSYWFHHTYPTRIEHERFKVYVYRCPEEPHITLNEEQVNPAWNSKEELAAIYKEDLERISLPLRLTYENLLTESSDA